MSREQSDRLDSIWRTRMADTIAECWWKYEMNWDEDLMSIPEIVLSTEDEDEAESENEEPFLSVSRRNSSLYTLSPYMPNRCNSIESVASSGFGSVWSGPTIQRRLSAGDKSFVDSGKSSDSD
jgi:hypothetical protein